LAMANVVVESSPPERRTTADAAVSMGNL